MAQPRIYRLTCPYCNKYIPLLEQWDLSSATLCCPNCGVKIIIDNKKSDKAVELIKKLNKLNYDGNNKEDNR